MGPPTNEAKDEMMKVLFVEVVAPAALKERERLKYREAHQPWKDQQGAAHAAVQEDSAPDPQIVLGIDGEDKFLQAVMEALANKIETDKDFERFVAMKFAAACSKSQQPADYSPVFITIKSLLKAWLRKELDEVKPHWYPFVVELLARMPKASRDLFLRFLAMLPDLLDSTFTSFNIKAGWRKSGVWPVDAVKILRQCPLYADHTRAQEEALLAAIPKLAELVKKNGQVTDREIQQAVGEAVIFTDPTSASGKADQTPRAHRKQLHEMVINRRRALVLTHTLILRMRRGAQATPEDEEASDSVQPVSVVMRLTTCRSPRNTNQQAAAAALLSKARQLSKLRRQRRPGLSLLVGRAPQPGKCCTCAGCRK